MEIITTGILTSVVAGLILYYVFGIGKQKHSTRFSEKQYIITAPSNLGGVDCLYLDSVATLRLFVPYNEQSITLIQDVTPLILPDRSAANTKIEDTKFFYHGGRKTYIFDIKTNKKNKIKVEGRIFIVSLNKVEVLHMPEISKALKYEFSIFEK